MNTARITFTTRALVLALGSTLLISACSQKNGVVAEPTAAYDNTTMEKSAKRMPEPRHHAVAHMAMAAPAPASMERYMPQPVQRESYEKISDNPVKVTANDAISTLSLDVDTASYSNVRRFLKQGKLPPADAVRVEELVNYFPYQSPVKSHTEHPFSLSTELAPAPWNQQNVLLRVGVKAVEQNVLEMPAANLVFLIDVSGSMSSDDKLPLVKASLKQLVNELRAQDRISIVVYSGHTEVVLKPTAGNKKAEILAAIEPLNANGSTAGGDALKLAYTQAKAGFIKGGINRILMATDGDFNVGITNPEELKTLVSRERTSGITLTTLGFGQHNYQAAMMESIANAGNGNFSYIDSLPEARKVLVEELSSTFNTVAADVKLQLEFNPSVIAEWRLIGYENRVLATEDFKNDKVDAVEIGAGKTVTALYELTPVGKTTLHDERRYGQKPVAVPDLKSELGFLKIRYKKPNTEKSIELSHAIANTTATPSADFKFASAVAGFGQLLRGAKYTGTWSFSDAKALANQGLGNDALGYRREFIQLVDLADSLMPKAPTP